MSQSYRNFRTHQHCQRDGTRRCDAEKRQRQAAVDKTICPGKFLLMLGGDIGAVQQAIETGTSQAGEMLVDSLGAGEYSPSVLPAISGLNIVDSGRRRGSSKPGAWRPASAPLTGGESGSNVTLVRVHMAFGIGGKCYMVVAGDIADVDNAVTVASDSAGEKGLLVYRAVIPRPHDALWQQLVEG